ncbi:hypothetical protein [Shumkonia mesophila]|uniref:hypothetical protein n=1 Tax=Shumkonia mesophila TaxID=2838854 RepID=UPI0029352288|nr:hypothetical protein [Shumkonia mesophila]
MYQFFHFETYALNKRNVAAKSKNGKKNAPRWTIDEIVAELTRKKGACDHVEKPEPPVLVYGENPECTVDEIKRCAAIAKDQGRYDRGLRKDAQLLISGVASWPVRRADIDADGFAEYLRWEKATVEHLVARWGSNLKYVLRHSDEEFFHVHYGTTATFDPATKGYSIADLHPGIAARERAREEAAAKGEEPKRGKMEAAYRDAMRQVQDEYFDQVSTQFGLTRDGPKRERLTRAEWKAKQAMGQKVANIVSERDALRVQLDQAIAANPAARDNEALLTLARNLEIRERDEREKRIRLEQREDFLRRRLAGETERADTAEREVSRLSEIVRTMKSWVQQATGVIKRLLAGAEKIADRRPEWMPEDVWKDIARCQKEARVEAAVEAQAAAIEIRESRGNGRPSPAVQKKKVA